MGGRISVSSKRDAGSIFSVILPFGVLRPPRAAASAADSASDVTPNGRGPDGAHALRILVAEDNVVNQRVAVRLLEKQGHRVIIASNGREVLETLRREPSAIDLVLMDVQMPEMDGLEATAEIRRTEQATGRHLPIVALTAHAYTTDRKRCLDAGMDNYLSKPFSGEDMARVISEAMHSKPQSPQQVA
jgi:CheY-like chemotaxis protein